jgi:hypothetical protein
MKDGYVALISVLVVGAVATSIATSLLLFGVGAAKSGTAQEQSSRAQAFATACMEEALEQIHDASAFTGSATLLWPEGSCTYTVTNLGGANRMVIASSTVGSAVRRSQATINKINPAIGIASWQEVADF